jgi:predicted Holliday junction resolvase-like endonuclease
MNYFESPLAMALAVVCALLLAAVVLIVIIWQRYEKLLETHERELKEARKDSVDRSRSTLKGQIAEQMAPLLAGFPYRPADARFLGDPVDYVVFDGYSDHAEPEGDDEGLEIVLLEVKQGQSKLSAAQRAIARAVEQGRVRFEVSRVAEDGSVTTNVWPSNRSRAATEE